jgi:hypothetical protein
LVPAAFAVVRARVVGYGPFFLCVIHKDGLCPSSGDINRLTMMMMNIPLTLEPGVVEASQIFL